MRGENKVFGDRPRLLDLFCGAGGAAMGYHRAGFDIVGVDIEPQKNYPFEFHQADAMTYPLDGFDAVHASPPCQGYSRMRHLPWLKGRVYPMLIEPTRDRLNANGVPWVMENVYDAPLSGIWLCGTQFGVPLLRHRRFEPGFFELVAPSHAAHKIVLATGGASIAKRYAGHGITGAAVKEINRDSVAGHFAGVARAREIMGIDWMKRDELAQAIPPVMTEFVGHQLWVAVAMRAAIPVEEAA
jgi:DNA (cytosine-5)-methyltransferase 1